MEICNLFFMVKINFNSYCYMYFLELFMMCKINLYGPVILTKKVVSLINLFAKVLFFFKEIL